MKFDSAYDDSQTYDAINNSFQADIPFYLKEIGAGPRRILELASGTGRVTLPLLRAGHKVTAVDISEPLLKALALKTADEGFEIEAIIEADMANFEISGEFDFILIPYKALQHLHSNADVAGCLSRVKKHLHENGRLIFDVFNPDLKLLSRDPEEFIQTWRYKEKDGQVAFVFEKLRYDKKSQVSKIHWSHRSADGAEVKTSSLNLRMFFPLELTALLEFCGFRIEKYLGDYDGTRFESSSMNQIIVARNA